MATLARILVLEDDEAMREMLTSLLQDEGYLVTAVDRGEKAVEAASRTPFDLIVADVRMEGIDGLTAMERAREHQPEIGTLVVTGYADPEAVARADRMNVGAYLSKPFRMQEFLDTVRRQVGGGQRQEVQRQQGQQLRQLTLWALRRLIRVADEAALIAAPGSLHQISEAAVQMAARLGWSAEVSEELAVAAPLAALRIPPPACLQSAQGELPTLAAVLHDDRLQTATEVARVARAAILESAQLEHPDQAGLAAELVALYRRPDETRPSSARPQDGDGRLERGLLSLAQALAQAGDHQSALKAYQEVSEGGSSAATVAALHGQARLELERAQGPAAARLLERSLQIADRLGPVAGARSRLQTALLQLEGELDGARESLEQVLPELTRLGLEAGEALVQVALSSFQHHRHMARAVYRLAQPHCYDDTLAAARWLLPVVLGLCHQQPENLKDLRRLVNRLAGDLPDLVSELMRRQRLDVPRRRALVDSLIEWKEHCPTELIELLRQDSDPQVRASALSLTTEKAASPILRIHSFGYFTVFRGDRAVSEEAWKTRKIKYLVAMLAARWDEGVLEEKVLAELWPDSLEKGKQSLYWSTSAARRIMRAEEGDEEPLIVREGDLLMLNPKVPHWHDLQEFERALQSGLAATQPGEAVRHLRRGLELQRGPYMDGCMLDWAVEKRRDAQRLLVDGLARLAHHHLDAREYQEALEVAEQLVGEASYDQEAHLLVMRAHLGLSQPEKAVRQFRRCETILRQEYDVEPSIKLLEFYHRARLGLGDS